MENGGGNAGESGGNTGNAENVENGVRMLGIRARMQGIGVGMREIELK